LFAENPASQEAGFFALRAFLRMTLSENRFPLFGVMRGR